MPPRSLKPQPFSPITRQTLRTPIADQLRSWILDGHLAPGDRIVESAVALKLAVSRAPLREALWQLAKEGLVRFEANRGAFVATLSSADVENIFEIRQALETRAAVRIFQRQDPEAFAIVESRCQALEKAGAKQDMQAFAAADVAFHKAIWQQSGNPLMEELLTGVTVRLFGYGLIRDLPRASAYQFERVVAEHRKLVTLMRKGPEERIVRGFAKALTSFRDYSLERFASAPKPKSEAKRKSLS